MCYHMCDMRLYVRHENGRKEMEKDRRDMEDAQLVGAVFNTAIVPQTVTVASLPNWLTYFLRRQKCKTFAYRQPLEFSC